MKLKDAYFGYKILDFDGNLITRNLFGSIRVLDSIAAWKTMSSKNKKRLLGQSTLDQIGWCFGDTRGRCEYEMLVKPWPKGGEEQKVDTYTMVVEPNKDLLNEIVDKISVASCREWKKERKHGK